MLKRLKLVCATLFLMGVSAGVAFAVSDPGIADVKIAHQDGASVVVKGTTNGTITGIDGDFSLSDVSKGDILQISFVG